MACWWMWVRKSVEICVNHSRTGPTEGGEKQTLLGLGITDLESWWVCLVGLSTPVADGGGAGDEGHGVGRVSLREHHTRARAQVHSRVSCILSQENEVPSLSP